MTLQYLITRGKGYTVIKIPAYGTGCFHASFPKILIQRIAGCLEEAMWLAPANSLPIPLEGPTLQHSFRFQWIMLGSEDQTNLSFITCIAILYLHFEAVRVFPQVSGI